MRRVLIRGTKSPFEAISPEVVLLDNRIANNSGNLLFLETAFKILSTRDAEVTADRLQSHKIGADEINERFDVYVIPLANAFRPSFEPTLQRLTSVIERLKIPVVVLGVGVQRAAWHQPGAVRTLDGTVTRFARAVLDRSPSIGVRGEITQSYLAELGFRDVQVIGCPSMFLHGPEMAVTKRPALERDARIGMGITPGIMSLGPIIASHLERYPNLEYLAQDIDALRLMLWGESPPGDDGTSPLPSHVSHPFLRDDKSLFFVDPWPWLDHMKVTDFVFGTRIHGSIAAVLSGTPSYLFAHDARTLELARYFDLPHRQLKDVPPDIDAGSLFDEADFGPLVAGHPERFRRFTGYLEAHDLRHVFQPGEDPSLFDAKLARVHFPPAVRARTPTVIDFARRRARNRYRRYRKAVERRLARLSR
jgi:hypothetical protein